MEAVVMGAVLVEAFVVEAVLLEAVMAGVVLVEAVLKGRSSAVEAVVIGAVLWKQWWWKQ